MTPAPPTTPKNTFTRSFQQLSVSKDLSGRPPRPININNSSLNASENFINIPNGELSKTAPANLITNLIPPSPPTAGSKTRPNHRGGWTSAERLMSASLRLSRASTRTSLASDDLDRYMTTNEQNNFGGSLGNIINPNMSNGFLNENSLKSNSMNNGLNKPLVQPRITSSSSANNNRIPSGRMHDTTMQSAASYEAPNLLIPPPVKVKILSFFLNYKFSKIL